MRQSKVITGIIIMATVAAVAWAWFSRDNKGGTAADNESGSIIIMGSTALQPLVEEAANRYMGTRPRARVLVQGGGSGTGLTQVAQGGAHIGNSDIYAAEKSGIDAGALVDHKVAVVGFAVVVNKGVTVDNLTQQQLTDIFTGKIVNWSKVGGPNVNIVLINRPQSSGTRAAFKKYALGGAEEASGLAITTDSSGAVLKTISETAGAIGYLSLGYINSSVKVLQLNGVAANAESITTGKYPIWSYEHMYTKGEPTGLIKSFLDYMLTAEVQTKLLPQLGFISISDMQVEH